MERAWQANDELTQDAPWSTYLPTYLSILLASRAHAPAHAHVFATRTCTPTHVGRPDTDPWEYALALRKRLDASGKRHVRIIAPDGDISGILPALSTNASYKAATWGLGQHYPGGTGTTAAERAFGMPLWSSEDYSTYSDATGAGCWARQVIQTKPIESAPRNNLPPRAHFARRGTLCVPALLFSVMSLLLEFIFMLRCTYHDGCVHCMRRFTACVVCVQCRP